MSNRHSPSFTGNLMEPTTITTFAGYTCSPSSPLPSINSSILQDPPYSLPTNPGYRSYLRGCKVLDRSHSHYIWCCDTEFVSHLRSPLLFGLHIICMIVSYIQPLVKHFVYIIVCNLIYNISRYAWLYTAHAWSGQVPAPGRSKKHSSMGGSIRPNGYRGRLL